MIDFRYIFGSFQGHFGDLFVIKIVIKFYMHFGSGKKAKKEPTRALGTLLPGMGGVPGRSPPKGGIMPFDVSSGILIAIVSVCLCGFRIRGPKKSARSPRHVFVIVVVIVIVIVIVVVIVIIIVIFGPSWANLGSCWANLVPKWIKNGPRNVLKSRKNRS